MGYISEHYTPFFYLGLFLLFIIGKILTMFLTPSPAT